LWAAGVTGTRQKRPIYASIASELSDKVVLTSDNPRNEDPDIIIKEMEEGVAENYKKYLR
jgi:UDP-N-acetylmuramoyl-L-alanyl-D-glutamate--2,6-diaminopimelate ligase